MTINNKHFPIINSNSDFVGRNIKYLATDDQFYHPQDKLGFGSGEKQLERKRVKVIKRKGLSKYILNKS